MSQSCTLLNTGLKLENGHGDSEVLNFHGHLDTSSTLESHVLASSIPAPTSTANDTVFHFCEMIVDKQNYASSKIKLGNTSSSSTGTDYSAVAVEIAGGLASGTTIGHLTLANGSITDSSGAISFGNENLSTTGTLGCGVLAAAAGSAVGNLTLANGSITDSSGAISFGNENLSTTGTLGCGVLTAGSGSTIGNLTLANGSITDSSGAISFGNENLSTNGTLGCGVLTASSGSSVGNLTLANGSITTSAGNGITFGSDNLTTSGNINCDGNIACAQLSTTGASAIGDLTLANGSITDASGAISFGNENLSTTGTLGCGVLTAGSGSTIGNLTLANGSITDSSGAISFGNENLSTTGTLGCGALTAGTGSVVGNLTLGNGSITDSSGAISFGDENLSTTGNMTAVSFTASSDRRIKENIQEHDPQETHTNVMKLKGVDYNLIADENKSMNTGFVAQEVEEVFPQFVKQDSNGMKSINYAQMTAVLLSALQHQNSLIEKLTARVAALESA